MKKKLLFITCLLNTSIVFSGKFLDVVAPYMPKSPIIVEAGAHNGKDTVIMKKRWPGATIYAFEPREDMYEKLCNKVAQYDGIYTYQLALGDKVGMQKFYLSNPNRTVNYGWNSDAQSSLFPPLKENWPKCWDDRVKFDFTTTVEVTTLDTWVAENNITRVDFLWLDLQGNEYQALSSSPEFIKLVSVIKTEVSTKPLYEGTLEYASFHKWLLEQGFTCLIKCPGFHGDALYVKSHLR